MEAVVYQCPNCGAPLEFNSETQRWDCKFCLSSFEKEQLEQITDEQKKKEEEELKISIEKRKAELAEKSRIIDEQEALSDPSSRTCFQCEYNLQWANRNGYANCGAWKSISVPQKTPPSCARACKRFRRIIS